MAQSLTLKARSHPSVVKSRWIKSERSSLEFPQQLPANWGFLFWGISTEVKKTNNQSVGGGFSNDWSGHQPLGRLLLKCETTCRVTCAAAGETCVYDGHNESQLLWRDRDDKVSLMELLSKALSGLRCWVMDASKLSAALRHGQYRSTSPPVSHFVIFNCLQIQQGGKLEMAQWAK